MMISSTVIKTKLKKDFFIKDKDNLVKIRQPNVMEVAFFYAVILEKLKKSTHYSKF